VTLIVNQDTQEKRGNKRKAVNNKAHLYPQNSTFGLGTIGLDIRRTEEG
jgi:hypothetical protein